MGVEVRYGNYPKTHQKSDEYGQVAIGFFGQVQVEPTGAHAPLVT